jgi:Lon protease-like protein
VALLPLFPLKTVLFPNTTLPLHIFEERYRTMIGRCIDQRTPFGVVLIRSGEEVGEAAEPFDIGTTARIIHVETLPDGRMNAIAFGQQRFRICSLDKSESFLQGEVELLDSTGLDAPENDLLVARTSGLFTEHFRLVLAISGQWMRGVDLPSDAAVLSDFLAGNLDLPVEERQPLLEMLSVPERLSRLAVLMGERLRALSERWESERREKFAGARLN